MSLESLQALGLTANESNIYLCLLKRGSSLAGEITEKSGIHRRNVYDSLERLIQKGLVSFVVINKRKYFSATDPKRFLGIIGEQELALERQRQEVQKMIPQLIQQKDSEKLLQDVHFFRGVEGLKSLYEEILQTGKDYFGYGPGDRLEKILRFYFDHFQTRRKASRIHARLIYGEKARGKKYSATNQLNNIRFLPEEYSSHAALRIFGDHVAILLLEEDQPLAIVIKNRQIALGYKKYFEVIWQTARE